MQILFQKKAVFTFSELKAVFGNAIYNEGFNPKTRTYDIQGFEGKARIINIRYKKHLNVDLRLIDDNNSLAY